MTPKPTKIVDIQAPNEVTAAASGRPLVVTNRPVLTDPMMKSADAATADKPAEPITRTAKTIKPLESSTPSTDQPTAASQPDVAEAPAEQPSEITAPPAAAAVAEVGEPAVTRDAAAEAAAAETQAEAAQLARQQELEQLVASGKYFVPINAAGRKRSRTYALLLAGCALLLGVVLLDVVLDMGLIKLPASLPHTHFFK